MSAAARVLVLVLAELRHRAASAGAFALVVAVATAWACTFVLLARAAEKETRIIQRDIGLNVVVISAEEDLDRYWAQGFAEASFPAEYVARLEDQNVANRLIPMLRRRVSWGDVEVMLTGIGAERFQGGKRMKAAFGMEVPAGELVVGGTIARRLALAEGTTVDFLGHEFRVSRVLAETGSEEDVRVYTSLAEAQRLLDAPGRLNEIQALECHCGEDVLDPLAALRAELEPLLPGTRVLRRADLADARRTQRLQAEGLLALATPLVLVFAALIVGALAWANVRARRAEVGVLRTLGWASGSVAALFLLRAGLLATAGALVGASVGGALANTAGERVFRVVRGAVEGDPALLGLALLLAPPFAMIASLVPTLVALRADPAEMLVDV